MKKYNYIYLIRNSINKKIYIGKHSTNNLDDKYMGSGKLIKLALKKYGLESFEKEIIAYADNINSLNFLEKYYIKKYKSMDPNIGYNLTVGGDGTLGFHMSEEAKQKISKATKGENNPMYDKPGTRLGKKCSEETKQKMKNSQKGHYQPPATEEQKRKISDALKGRKHTDEHNKKVSDALKGRKVSDEQKARAHKKYKYMAPDGTIYLMRKANATRYHKDYKLIE